MTTHETPLQTVFSLVAKNDLALRIKHVSQDEPSAWTHWIGRPVVGYIELQRIGPIALSDIDWLEINAIEERHMGRLMPAKRFDHTDEIIDRLIAGEIRHAKSDKAIRIYLSPETAT